MPDTTVRPGQLETPQDPVSINDQPQVKVTGLGLPVLWPVVAEDQVRRVLVEDMRSCAGVPTGWWGEDQEILVATHDPRVAVKAADELARRDLGDGYLTVVGTGAVVVGPIDAVLVGWPTEEHLDWVSAPVDADYAVSVCLVRPAVPITPDVDRRTAVVDIAAEVAAWVHDLGDDIGGDPR
jgi:hypothetical protein